MAVEEKAVPQDAIVEEDHDAVRVLRINRPHRLNSLDPTAIVSLRGALERFRDDESARVAVLTGTGERGFCTGADLHETLPPEVPFAVAFLAPDAVSVAKGNYIRSLDIGRLRIGKPLIAAINGHAWAGGMELAMACDIRVASTTATFSLPEVKIGSVPAVGGMLRLLRSIPHSKAMTMVLTGEAVGAEEAERLGIVSSLYSPDELMAGALTLARKIAANAPLAVRAARLAAHEGGDMTAQQALLFEQMVWGLLRDTDDRKEGRKAFSQKRPPVFHGR